MTKGKKSTTSGKAKNQHRSEKDFLSDEDAKESRQATEREGKTLKIAEGKTPIRLLSGAYVDGFAHWVNVEGQKQRIPCGGGFGGKGFAPDECPICNVVKERYAQSRDLESNGKPKAAKALRNATNQLRAQYECHMIAAQGEMQYVGKDKKTGKKKFEADFDDATVGILSLTKKQFEDLNSLADSGKYDFIEGRADLLSRYIVFDKAKRGEASYATTEFIPSRTEMDEEIEYDEEEFNLQEDFEISEDRMKKAARALMGGKSSTSKKKHDVDYEDDSDDEDSEEEDDDEEEDSDDFEEDKDDDDDSDEDDEDTDDDSDEEEESVSKKNKSKKGKSTEDDDDVLDDFEDDDPFEDEEEGDEDGDDELEAPTSRHGKSSSKTAAKKTPVKRATARKDTSTSRAVKSDTGRKTASSKSSKPTASHRGRPASKGRK